MCGITGILHHDKDRPIENEILKKMTDSIKHRGPDDEGYFINRNLGLGHRRLSIIDLNDGNQPMHAKESNLVIVYNGEIYNYIELREELKKLGYRFSTNSDTEVILKSYEEWGYDCQNKFNGMWAFAIWDKSKEELFLSRDRIGEKPLFYASDGNTFLFGSEIKCISSYGFKAEINEEMLEIYLTLSYVPAPNTFYKNIKKLPPGHFMVVKNGSVKIQQYWELPQINESKMLTDKEEIYENFEYLFKDSIRLRMRSDVQYGAFLSGGLDSSSIVAIMSEISSYPVNTYTIGYDDKAFDESDLAELVAKSFNTNHHLGFVKEEDFETYLEHISHHFDEPFGDSSAIPTNQVCNYASKDVKMVLTGDGGDELLSGYTGYQGEKFANHYKLLPTFLRNGLPNFIGQFSNYFSGKQRYKINRIQNVLEDSNKPFVERLHNKVSRVNPNDLEELLRSNNKNNIYPVREYLENFFKDCPYNDEFYKLMYFHLKISLPDDMLTKVDRMSMSNSIETRAPFLDYRLIEFMTKVDKKIKMQGYQRKSILKKTVAQKLPKKLLFAKKMGFGVPVREWFKNKKNVESLINNSTIGNYVNQNKLEKLIQKNMEGKIDYGIFIWSLSVFGAFINKHKY
ncbi:MAG: asparagine synthase (glutamine-hydrolyzing) [Cytophagales bacterium]|jgi:asparagine synthase (glutamine-hydrolysing)